jgi:hypothetical protein
VAGEGVRIVTFTKVEQRLLAAVVVGQVALWAVWTVLFQV